MTNKIHQTSVDYGQINNRKHKYVHNCITKTKNLFVYNGTVITFFIKWIEWSWHQHNTSYMYENYDQKKTAMYIPVKICIYDKELLLSILSRVIEVKEILDNMIMLNCI